MFPKHKDFFLLFYRYLSYTRPAEKPIAQWSEQSAHIPSSRDAGLGPGKLLLENSRKNT